jgi:hypothetical protein
MKKLLTRGLLGIAALAVPVGALMALPMAANAAPATPAAHINDPIYANGAADQGYADGTSFYFFDGNAQGYKYSNYVYKDVVATSGNETEVFIGHADAKVPNDTGSVVTYNAAHNPNGPGQTALSFATGRTTPNWTLTIQPDGQWNLTANFSK